MPIPHDYLERVYAGVLGKIIGVYLGRPFEGWEHQRILDHLGEVWYYVNDRLSMPLVVTDDDISGTFTFLRALEDFGYDPGLSAKQIGQTWLNYLIEHRTVLWWGGLGNSTEHTAWLRLKQGLEAPLSGAAETNGKVVSDQIGAQIFIDGWAMAAPGDPALAADLARRAGSVSHDGEAIYGAQVIAAMEAQAFVESDIPSLIETGLSFIPHDSVIYRVVRDLQEWHAELPSWYDAFKRIQGKYGYDKYGGNCHMVPNHALIHLGLLYGDGDFQKSLMITNTAGWDTDCNAANIGCLMGIRGGLAGLDAGVDFRGPVADRLYMPTAEGSRVITDAVQEAVRNANAGLALQGQPAFAPKDGARFHFSFPGSVQGFQALPCSPLRVDNAEWQGARRLRLSWKHAGPGQELRASTATFLTPEGIQMPGYALMASPTLNPGQRVIARLGADEANAQPVQVGLFLSHYSGGDKLVRVDGPRVTLQPSQEGIALAWDIPECGHQPIAAIGLEIIPPTGMPGAVYLDRMDWKGTPNCTFTRPAEAGKAWRVSWISSCSESISFAEPLRLVHNHGIGMLSQGGDWEDLRAESELTPHMAEEAGLAVRVQGLERYYALKLVKGDRLVLVKRWYGADQVLAGINFPWQFGEPVSLTLEVRGQRLSASADGKPVLEAEDTQNPLTWGGVGLLVCEGRLGSPGIRIQP